MSRRNLVILFGVAIALALALFLTPSGPGDDQHEILLPGLKGDLNTIERIVISAGGAGTVATLERGEDQWTLAERSGYPADVARIRRNLIALGNATIAETKTSNPELYGRLGIEDPDQPDAKGYLLRIYEAGQGDGEATGLIVGDTGVRGNMAYVRRAGEAQGFMVSADLDLSKKAVDWLSRDLMDIASSDIQAIRIEHPDGEVVRIEKTSRGEADFSVLDIPDGRELAYASIANPAGGLLSKLEMDDVSPADSIDTGTANRTIVRFSTFDGLVVQANVYHIDDNDLVGFSVTADESLAERFRPAATPESESPAGAGIDPAPFVETATLANELNARLESWVYSLPTFKSDQLVKRLDDLLAAEGE
jgi:hypothetical protein